MKNLILIRHAKAEGDSISGRDFDRSISKSGAEDAEAVALAASSFLPELYSVLCSSAKRTSQTAAIFCRKMGYPIADVSFSDNLYTFDLSALEHEVRSQPDTTETIVIFCHNEAITDFVNKFGDILIDNVPTSGFVSIIFDTTKWSDIKNGKTIKTIFPRDLIK
ncbi:MAG TPA: histidine phosphatase family protein [Flavobacterium sp.]|jgi:phosphohistidine phosphatase